MSHKSLNEVVPQRILGITLTPNMYSHSNLNNPKYYAYPRKPRHHKPLSPISKRSVSFSPYVHVKRTLHINNYSLEEIEASWYDQADFQRMRDEDDVIVQMMEKRQTIDEAKYCTRGLEFRTTQGAQQRLRNKAEARDAVLDEQDVQWTMGMTNPQALSSVYAELCKHCSITATMIGRMDEASVRGFDARGLSQQYKKRTDSMILRSSSQRKRRV